MSESKRGVVMLIQAGDPEITGAITEGIMTARGAENGDLIRPASGAALVNQRLPTSAVSPERRNRQTQRGAALRATFPIGGRLTEEERRAVEAEIDRQAIEEAMNRPQVQRSLLRVAVGNSKTSEDYAMLRFEADMKWGESLYEPGWWDRIADKALGIYGLFVWALAGAYKSQDRVLGG